MTADTRNVVTRLMAQADARAMDQIQARAKVDELTRLIMKLEYTAEVGKAWQSSDYLRALDDALQALKQRRTRLQALVGGAS